MTCYSVSYNYFFFPDLHLLLSLFRSQITLWLPLGIQLCHHIVWHPNISY